jgi:hypothetical protein
MKDCQAGGNCNLRMKMSAGKLTPIDRWPSLCCPARQDIAAPRFKRRLSPSLAPVSPAESGHPCAKDGQQRLLHQH